MRLIGSPRRPLTARRLRAISAVRSAPFTAERHWRTSARLRAARDDPSRGASGRCSATDLLRALGRRPADHAAQALLPEAPALADDVDRHVPLMIRFELLADRLRSTLEQSAAGEGQPGGERLVGPDPDRRRAGARRRALLPRPRQPLPRTPRRRSRTPARTVHPPSYRPRGLGGSRGRRRPGGIPGWMGSPRKWPRRRPSRTVSRPENPSSHARRGGATSGFDALGHVREKAFSDEFVPCPA